MKIIKNRVDITCPIKRGDGASVNTRAPHILHELCGLQTVGITKTHVIIKSLEVIKTF